MGLGCCFLLVLSGGCATAPRVAPGAGAPATLVLSNPGQQHWRISLREVGGEAVRTIALRGEKGDAIVLPAGEYTLEQALFGADGIERSRRTLRLRLESGAEYDWVLTSLFAAQSAATAQPAR